MADRMRVRIDGESKYAQMLNPLYEHIKNEYDKTGYKGGIVAQIVYMANEDVVINARYIRGWRSVVITLIIGGFRHFINHLGQFAREKRE